MSSKVVVVGSINMDMFGMVPHLPRPGETVLGDRFFSTVGGKGANQAIAMARLGCSVSFVARVGKDLFGQKMLSTLRDNKIDTTFVIEDEEESSGVALVNVDKNGEDTVVVIPGANRRLTPDDVHKADKVIKQAKVVVTQLEIAIETVEAAFELAKRHRAVSILNPAPGYRLPETLLANVDILTPNETELGRLANGSVKTRVEMERACRKLLNCGVGAVVLTLGGEGVMAVDKNGSRHYPALSVDVVDTTGAGDAFTGVMAAEMAQGADLDSAVEEAIIVAGYSVTKPGAQPSLPTRAEFEVFAKSARKQEVS